MANQSQDRPQGLTPQDLHAARAEIAKEGIRGLFVMNGGGAVALLAFLQAIWKEAPALAEYVVYASARMLAYILAINDKKSYQDLVIKLLSDEKSPLVEAASLATYSLSPEMRQSIYDNLSSANVKYVPGGWFKSNVFDVQLPARLARISHIGSATPEHELEPLQLGFAGNTVASRSTSLDASRTLVVASFPYNIDKHRQALTMEVKVGTDRSFAKTALEFEGKRMPSQDSEEGIWSFELHKIRGDGFCFMLLENKSMGICE